jgi:hypothetical protein
MRVADQLDAYIAACLRKIIAGQTVTLYGGEIYTFQTSAGAQVDKNLEYTENPDVTPSIVFYTGKNSTHFDGDPEPELGMENHLQELSVEGFIECDKAGTEAECLRQDIVCALRHDPWWGGLIENLESIETDISINIGETVFGIVKFSSSALYTVPFGSE